LKFLRKSFLRYPNPKDHNVILNPIIKRKIYTSLIFEASAEKTNATNDIGRYPQFWKPEEIINSRGALNPFRVLSRINPIPIPQKHIMIDDMGRIHQPWLVVGEKEVVIFIKIRAGKHIHNNI